MPVPVYSMWGDREPLYVILVPMMSLVDVLVLVHAGNLYQLHVSYRCGHNV
jgi:hypothetical protein